MIARLPRHRILYILPMLAVLTVLLGPARFTVRSAPVGATIQAESWSQNAAALEATAVMTETSAPGGYRMRTYDSEMHRVSFTFNAVATTWEMDLPPASEARLFMRFGADGETWSGWTGVTNDDDSGMQAGRNFGNLLVHYGSVIQYRVQLIAKAVERMPQLSMIGFTFINSQQGPAVRDVAARRGVAYAAEAPRIISRAEWGALESLRFDDSGREIWPRRYTSPRKAIIHETVTMNDDPNPPATVRAIYYYHAITRGWGDIGYHYLVDQAGNIYEGRAGGENVVAGHARCFNYGTLGISALGEYNSADPSSALVRSIIDIIAWQFEKNDIDPFGSGVLGDYAPRDIPNIAAHRDLAGVCGNTHQDPGINLYAQLPEIRQAVADRISDGETPEATPTPDGDEPTPTPDDEEPAPGTEPAYMVINTKGEGLNLRDRPSMDSQIIAIVPDGTTIQEITSEIDGWVKTVYEGKTGYLWYEYLQETEEQAPPVEPVTEPKYRVRSYGLNLRERPTRNSRSLAILPRGTVVQEITSEIDGWVKTVYGGKTGYLWYAFLEELESDDGAGGDEEDTDDGNSEPRPLGPGSTAVISGTPDGLNLRESHGDNYTAVTSIPEGAEVTITGEAQHGWYPVAYTDASGREYTGWAWGQFLESPGAGAAQTMGAMTLVGAMAVPAWRRLRRHAPI